MSNIYLALALVGTFIAIMLIGMAIDLVVGERRRTRLLESQVGQVVGGPTTAREEELQRPFLDRLIVPMGSGAARVTRRLTPVDTKGRIERKLILAGSPPGWDAERVAGFKVAGAIIGVIAGAAFGALVGFKSAPLILFIGLLAITGFFLPDTLLSQKVSARQRDIRNALPDVMDLLTISVEAGLSLNTALAQVVQNVPGVLSQEIGRMLQEIQLGVSRSDAFRNLGERTDVDELNAFVLAMIQADIFGVSISSVLRAQAKEGRVRRRQRAEHAAMQAPVKIVFPLILCIFPALLIVIVGPGAIRIINTIFR